MGQRVTEIMPGCKIAETSTGEAMFGCPSEIVKVLAIKKRSVPSTIILPSKFYEYGVVQAALEFPLYHFLFAQQRYFKGEKIRVAGSVDQIERVRKVLRMTLLGASEEEMRKWRISSRERKGLIRMRDYFALKNKEGEVASIDEMIEFIKLKEETANIGDVEIELVDDNVFKVTDQNEEFFVDINIAEAQAPPLPIEIPKILAKRSIFGVTPLGQCVSGFDPNGYTSGLIVWINGLGISVDGVAWMKEHLRLHGINPSEIKAFILTHIHDDHSNILDMIVNGEKSTIITTKIIFKSFLVKISNLLNVPTNKIRKSVKFIEVVPGEKFELYGATFDFWHTVHPIPTIGFQITVNGKSIVYGGDTLWGKRLDELKEKEIISENHHKTVSDIPFLESEVTFFDAGGGMIHPSPEELAKLPKQVRARMILTHVSFLPDKAKDRFDLVKVGQNIEIIPQEIRDVSDMMAVVKSPLLRGLDQEWLNVIISQGKIKEYPTNQVILEEGELGKNFYILLGGTAGVFYGDEEVAQVSTGDFFGEISLMENIPCTATIKTKSPVKTLEMERKLLLQIIHSTDLLKKLKQIHQIRPILIDFTIFKNLSPPNLNKIIASTNIRKYEKGEIIIRQGDRGDTFYGVIDGEVDVIANGTRVATLYRGHCFGEIALLRNEVRTADVIANTDVKVFAITKNKFKKIVGEIPSLSYQLGTMIKERRNDLLKKN